MTPPLAPIGPSMQRFERLVENLRSLGSVLVLYSGGLDSTLLLFAAARALGTGRERLLALTEAGPAHPVGEAEQAAALAHTLGVHHRVLQSREWEIEEFARNDTRRCYHCKRRLFCEAGEIAAAEGLAHVAEGTVTDDLSDWRPGLEAARELPVRQPLLEAGISKADARLLSRHFGLPTWDRPANPCLASRVAVGTRITRELLEAVGRLEARLAEAGLRVHRARVHALGDDRLLRIETSPEEIPLLTQDPLRQEILRAAETEGFRFVTLDLGGYRMGSVSGAPR